MTGSEVNGKEEIIEDEFVYARKGKDSKNITILVDKLKVDRFFPSSKRCHKCGFINESLTLAHRQWECPECNANHDRDLNAAINILLFSRAGTARIDACGERQK